MNAIEAPIYSNTHAGQLLTGEAIVNYAKAVWDAFPDMTLELISVSEMGVVSAPHRVLDRPAAYREQTAS